MTPDGFCVFGRSSPSFILLCFHRIDVVCYTFIFRLNSLLSTDSRRGKKKKEKRGIQTKAKSKERKARKQFPTNPNVPEPNNSKKCSLSRGTLMSCHGVCWGACCEPFPSAYCIRISTTQCTTHECRSLEFGQSSPIRTAGTHNQ